MTRILVGVYMVRYPLGGMLSNYVQWLVGLERLGCEVYAVEKALWPVECFDPRRRTMTDDCAYGFGTVHALLARFGLSDRLCFVDAAGRYHGLSRDRIERAFAGADVFLDVGTHGAWLEEAERTAVRVYVDGEPGARQMLMQLALDAGTELPRYDAYFSVGRNIGTARATAPTAGVRWRHVFHPVVVDLFDAAPAPARGAYTTVMNWRSHERLEYGGSTYGQKDAALERFLDLPRRVRVPLEIAAAGAEVPVAALQAAGWRLRDAHEVTASYDSFVEYVRSSRGEFAPAKDVYVATRSGWFGDRSAVYLASGRPVVLDDTGFSEHLPCGEGLFAVSTVEEAAVALDEIDRDHARHARAARAIAVEHLDAPRVLRKLLGELGL